MGRDRRSEASSSGKSRADRDDRKSESSSRRDKRRSKDRPPSEPVDDRRKLDRTTSWDREGERTDRKRKGNSSKKMSRSKTMDDHVTRGSISSGEEDESSSEGINMELEASGHFSAQVNAPGFNPFPGQNDPGTGQPPGVEHGHPAPVASSHVQDQFPGQDPGTFTTPYRPPIGANEGGPGLAADYYGDQGESVATQPGVRPQGPSVIVGAEPHLVAASSVPAPPIETGAGLAQDYFGGGGGSPDVQVGQHHHSPSEPSRPSKLGKHNTVSGIAAASAGAVLGSAAGHGNAAGSQTSVLANSSQTEFTSIHGQMASAPEVPTLGNISGGSEGKHHHSNAGMYAAGAAGLAAGAYALGHSGQHDKPSSGSQLPTYSEANVPHGSRPHGHPYGGAMAMRETEKGPLRRFVDWWKDYEDVRKMEEYTEYIGVCRGCFDPGTSAIDAPRKHHYHGGRRRRRSDRHRPSRVDKGSRYSSSSSSSSSDSDGGGNAAAWIGTAAAGYGLAKLGKSFLKGSDSDSSRKSSRKHGKKSDREHGHGHPSHSIEGGRRRRTSSLDGHNSYRVQGIARRRSRSQDLASGEIIVDAKQQKFIRHRRSRSSSGSSSSSADGKSALVGAGVGIAAGAAAASYLKSSDSRKGSKSPEAVLVRKRSKHKGRRSPTGSEFHVGESSTHHDSRHSGSSRHNKPYFAADAHGRLGGSSAVAVKEKRSKRKSKSKGGFSFFGNASTSSLSDNGLAFGAELPRTRKTKRKSSDEKLNAALVGLGATAGALAVAQGRNAKSKPNSSNIYMGGRERRGNEVEHDSDREDGWESASDDYGSVSSVSSCSSGAESALAFGGTLYGSKDPRARKSQESLSSDSSGTGKWGWRWGSKQKKKKQAGKETALATAAAAAAIGGAASSVSSLPPMQHVYPVQTSDPTRFETSRRNTSVSSVQAPLVTATRPEPTSVQPQPVRPVSNAVFTTGADISQPGYTVTSAPPDQQLSSFDNPYAGRQMPGPGHMHHSSTFPVEQTRDQVMAFKRPEPARRRSSPTSMSVARDTAIAGVVAGTVVSVLSNGKKKNRSSSAGVRFHDVKDDENQEECKDLDVNSRSERRRQRDEARQERLRREDEQERLRQIRREEMKQKQKDDTERKEATVIGQKMIKAENSDAPVAAAVVGGAMVATAGAAAAAAAVGRAGAVDPKIIQTVEIVPDQNPTLDEETRSAMFDPNYFNKRDQEKRQASVQRRPSADEIVADLEQRYQAKPQSMASFFAPPELLDQSKDMPSSVKPVVVPSFDGDRDLNAFVAPTIVTIEPPEGAASSFNVSKGGIDVNRIAPPWKVPMLNLIEPTPPASRAGSVFSPLSSPASFSDESVKKDDDEEEHQTSRDKTQNNAEDDVPADMSRSGSVSWGNSQTVVFEGTADQTANAKSEERALQSVDDKTRKGMKDAVLGEVVEEVVGDVKAVKEDEIIRSTSPEVEPIVVEPEDDGREGMPKSIPASVVFEAMTGFGPGDVLEEHSGQGEGGGFIEGEVAEERNRSIPGGFEEDINGDVMSREVDKVVADAKKHDDNGYEKILEKESEDDDFAGFGLSKKQKQKQKKKNKAAKRQSKDIGDSGSFAEDNDAAKEVNDTPAVEKCIRADDVTRDDKGTETIDDPSNEWEPLPDKKSKKAKNRKNAKKDAKFEPEVQQLQRSVSPAAIDTAVDGVLPGDGKVEDDSRVRKAENEKDLSKSLNVEAEPFKADGDDVDFDGDDYQGFSMSKKKSKKNKKGKGARAGKDDDWTEPAADTKPNTAEVAEPVTPADNDNSKDADALAFAPVSKKDKKKAKQKSKWASILSAVGAAAPAEAVDDNLNGGERESGVLGKGKVNGEAKMSDMIDKEEKDSFFDSRDEPQTERDLNEGTGVRRLDDGGKVLDLSLSSLPL